MAHVMNYFGEFARDFDDTQLPREQMSLTGTRRRMLSNPLYLTVHGVLTPLLPVAGGAPRPKSLQDAAQEFTAIVDIVGGLVKSDPRMSKAFTGLANWASAPVSNPDLIALFGHLRRPKSTIMGRLLSIAYLRTLGMLSSSSWKSEEAIEEVRKVLKDTKHPTAQLEQKLNKLDGDFIGYLVVEAEICARQMPFFAQTLDNLESAFTNRFKPKSEAKTYLEDSSEFGLEALGTKYLRRWWSLPAHVALAITIWALPS